MCERRRQMRRVVPAADPRAAHALVAPRVDRIGSVTTRDALAHVAAPAVEGLRTRDASHRPLGPCGTGAASQPAAREGRDTSAASQRASQPASQPASRGAAQSPRDRSQARTAAVTGAASRKFSYNARTNGRIQKSRYRWTRGSLCSCPRSGPSRRPLRLPRSPTPSRRGRRSKRLGKLCSTTHTLSAYPYIV